MLKRAIHDALIHAAVTAFPEIEAEALALSNAYDDIVRRAADDDDCHYISTLALRLRRGAERIAAATVESDFRITAENDYLFVQLKPPVAAKALLWLRDFVEKETERPESGTSLELRLQRIIQGACEERFDIVDQRTLPPLLDARTIAACCGLVSNHDFVLGILRQYFTEHGQQSRLYAGLLTALCDIAETRRTYDLVGQLENLLAETTIVGATDGGTQFQLCLLCISLQLLPSAAFDL